MKDIFMNKKIKLEHLNNKLKKIIDKAIQNKQYEKALVVTNIYAQILYQYNQKYIDEDLETNIQTLSTNLIKTTFNKKNINYSTILFYDDFGFDTRGLALIYLKAIAKLGYRLIYLRPKSKNSPKEIQTTLKGFNVIWETFSNNTHIQKINDINNIFIKYKPEIAFFYSYPDNIAGATVFCAYKNIVKRFQINLTDHAYWLGINAFDYCIEFRDYGAYISHKYRKIPKEKLIKLPFYPYYNKDIPFQGFPFDAKNKKIIFSGGALYKTLGDINNTYYKIINNILSNHLDVIFLYAGNGDTKELNKLMNIYPNRVYHIEERKDLYQLMQHITLYLNTYPILGGLMTQYAAIAGKIPITLTRKNDIFDDFLINQEKRNIEYTDVNTLLDDVDKLLNDDNYRYTREKFLIGSIISDKEFETTLQSIILKNNSKYSIHYKQYNIEHLLKEYLLRINYNTIVFSTITKTRNLSLLFFDFPILFLKKYIKNLFDKPLKLFNKLRS